MEVASFENASLRVSSYCLLRVAFTDSRIRASIAHSRFNGFMLRITTQGEREREIFISLWLQVHVTGPRHHLAGSLLTKRRGHDEKGREYLHGLQVWLFKVRSPVLYG